MRSKERGSEMRKSKRDELEEEEEICSNGERDKGDVALLLGVCVLV